MNKLAINRGAGILFVCLDDNSLFLLLRSPYVSEPGRWGVPGGTLEGQETPSQAAKRETKEEVGSLPKQVRPIQAISNKTKIGEYILFIVEISKEEKELWTPRIELNWEHTKGKWFKLNNLPPNIHSAIKFIQT